MIGTLVNAVTIIIGSVIGLLLHSRLPKKLTEIAFQGLGIFTIFLGVTMALKTSNYLIIIFSIVVGGILGELINLEDKSDRMGNYLKRKLKVGSPTFSEGLVTAFLLYCMGSMTILGAIEEGLGNRPNLLLAKSLLDGFAAIALSSTLGIGVMFSIIPLVLYQGGLTLLTKLLGNYFNELVINELTAVGGLLLIGMGLRVLEIKKIRVLNMLPALAIVIGLSIIFIK